AKNQRAVESAIATKASGSTHKAGSECVPPPVFARRGGGVTTTAARALWIVTVGPGVPLKSGRLIVTLVSAAAPAPAGSCTSWSVTTISSPRGGSWAAAPLQAAVRFQLAGSVKAAEFCGKKTDSLNAAMPLTPWSQIFFTD